MTDNTKEVSNTTVKDATSKAQSECNGLLCDSVVNEFKSCPTCRYKNNKEDEKPCSQCINSFCGIQFNASEWEAQVINT